MNALINPAMAAMYRKELRAVLRWTPLGLLLIGVLCWLVMPETPYDSSQVDARLMLNVGFGAGLVAFAFGLLQSLPELRPDARGFLLHRPISLGSIYLAKLLAGFTGFALSVFPPLIVVAFHLEMIGMQRMPASWVQVLPASIGVLMVFFAVYPATLWTVHRDARWTGTRLLPAVLGAAIALLACGLLYSIESIVGLMVYLLFLIVTLAIATHASLHAFRHQTFMPPASSPESMSASRGIGLFAASLILISAVSVLLLSYSRPMHRFRDYRTYQLSLSTDGELWETQALWNNSANGSNVKVVSGRRLTSTNDAANELSPIPDDWKETPETVLFAYRGSTSWIVKFHYWGPLRMASPNLYAQKSVVYDRVGRFYTYDTALVNGSFACVTPRGVFDAWETPEGRFTDAWMLRDISLVSSAAGQEMVIADRNGVYRVRFATKEVEKIIDAPLQYAGYFEGDEYSGRQSRIWTANGTDLNRYTVIVSKADSPEAKVEASGHWTVAPVENYGSLTIAETDDGVTAIAQAEWPDYLAKRFRVFEADGSLREEGRVRLHPNSNVVSGDRDAVFLPPAFLTAVFGVQSQINSGEGLTATTFWAVVALHAFSAMGLAVWIGHFRRLSMPKRVAWAIAGVLGGVGAPLAMAAIHQQPVYEPCPNCDQPRRVDLPLCESCGCEWKPPENDGNEILQQWPHTAEQTAVGSLAANA